MVSTKKYLIFVVFAIFIAKCFIGVYVFCIFVHLKDQICLTIRALDKKKRILGYTLV